MPLLVEDVRALAEKLGFQKFTLAGHGWGGVVGWAFASAHPEMLEYLVAINAPHPAIYAREMAKNPEQQKASSQSGPFAGEQAEATLSANNFERLQAIMGKFASDQDRKEYMACWKRGLTGQLNYGRAAGLKSSPDGGAALAEAVPVKPIAVPTMVIWGDQDSYLLPGNLDGLNEYVKTLTIKHMKDGSHWVVREKPGLVIGYIRDFIRP
jgi:epoxide hydrolase 4